MLKRKIKGEDLGRKQQIISNVNVKNIQHPKKSPKTTSTRLQSLPIELIRLIISNLNNSTDIKCLMMVSKEMRDLIFEVPEVMKLIKFKFPKDVKFEEVVMFLRVRGKFLRNLEFSPIWGSLKSLKCILDMIPNLEELTINTTETDAEEVDFVVDEIEKLLEFKKLEILRKIAENFLVPKKLRILSIEVPEVDDQEFLTNLILKQDNLKILKVSISSMDDPIFPSRDISQEVNFKLQKLNLSIPNINQTLFINFIQTQSTNLQELELNCISDQKIFELIFKNFKNLKKFTIDEDASEVIFSSFFPDLKIDTLKYFHDKNQNGTIVSKLFARFPNIETLKCCDTMQATGTFPKLTTLDVSEVYWPRIRNFKMPNLKNLFIKKIDRCDDEYYWTHFTENFLNIENITVEKVGNETKDVLRFVKRLKAFKKLKTFKLRHGIAIDHNYSLDDNELVEVENNFFKILIDTTSKTVKLSTYIVQNCLMIRKHLLKTFKGFEFFEFCFPELRVKKFF